MNRMSVVPKKTAFFVLMSIFMTMGSVSWADLQAPTCSPEPGFQEVDLRAGFGPLRVQGQSNWCYAFVAADLYGYWVLQNGGPDTRLPKNMVSAAAMAYDYNFVKRAQALGVQAANNTFVETAQKQLKDAITRRNQVFADLVKRKEALNHFDPRARKVSEELADLYADPAAFDSIENAVDVMAEGPDSQKREKMDLVLNMDVFGYRQPLIGERKQNLIDLTLMDEETANAYQKYLRINEEIKKLEELVKTLVPEPGFGSVARAMGSAFQRGYCTEEQIPSENFIYPDHEAVKQDGFSAMSLLNGIIGPAPRFSMSQVNPEEIGKNINSYVASEHNQSLFDEAVISAQMLFPKLPSEVIQNVLQSAKRESKDAIPWFSRLACSPRNRLLKKKPKIQEMIADNPQVLAEKVSQEIEKGHPVGITIYGRLFNYGGDMLKSRASSSTEFHAVIVVGQKWNCRLGEMDFIVRNSYADSCETMKKWVISLPSQDPRLNEIVQKNVTCERQCKTSTKQSRCVEECNNQWAAEMAPFNTGSYGCDQDYYLVPKSHLIKGLFGLTYLE